MTDPHAEARQFVMPPLPPNVRVGAETIITGNYIVNDHPLMRYRSAREPGLVIGARCLLDGAAFNVNTQGQVIVGDECWLQDCFLICEHEIHVGNRVTIGWHATLVDSNFHPLQPDLRMTDTEALSTLGDRAKRQATDHAPVIIGDDCWIGPNATILKGVELGAGVIVEPGAVVTKSVPAGARVIGNPARIVDGA